MGERNNVKVIIEYVPSSGNGEINHALTALSLSQKGNNTSNPSALDLPRAGGINPFILGVSKLGTKEQGGSGNIFWGANTQFLGGVQIGGKYSGFWSLQASNVNGYFAPSLQFNIIGTAINHFVMKFDQTLNEFATLINVDGVDYINNNNEFVWTGAAHDTHTIQIKQWNKPFLQAKITSITNGVIVEYNRTQIKSANVKINNTNNNSQVFYGVAAGNGAMELVDIDNSFIQFAEMDLLKAELPVQIYFNAPDRLEDENIDDYKNRIRQHMVGNFTTERFNYAYGNSNVNVDLQDDILTWGSIAFNGISINESNTALTFFEELNSVIQNAVNISPETKTYLQSFHFPDAFLPPSNLREAFNTLCWATATNIYKNRIGEIWLTM